MFLVERFFSVDLFLRVNFILLGSQRTSIAKKFNQVYKKQKIIMLYISTHTYVPGYFLRLKLLYCMYSNSLFQLGSQKLHWNFFIYKAEKGLLIKLFGIVCTVAWYEEIHSFHKNVTIYYNLVINYGRQPFQFLSPDTHNTFLLRYLLFKKQSVGRQLDFLFAAAQKNKLIIVPN